MSSETLFASQTNKPCLSQCEGRLRRRPTSLLPPPNLARWKQADYRRLARHRAAAAADRAFDAEVGIEPSTSSQPASMRCHIGKMLGGTVLIMFTDLYVAIPAHVAMLAPLLIPGAEPLTPIAMKAVEILDIAVVLPINILGIKMIGDSKCLFEK